ncbi:hypothetical protein GLOIN_2v1488957 [Rhizophagus irregularis DAOM 181602=DAOM 197198]|uniref:Uncharacterized protein n=1 Tax=Rhizophagus irregularis (strain DAOM 181602 / DAOM 197198 / MUCL 43194) TaxID=747089 RepID=A0A2P4NXX4_RHIID|nr:hypothetical protein GLOIN_2v1488957 [Rhizophagus irregularis DAOM 181602=DAOM 197198]POG57973.1 hypothetical protein GLOIN_2v1488957 [Rhizophagus irregularis DAOM 181602=DAOM 197198]|eukprot:XP_025164839.1 hypothetical protein GLOIN_2v1488957 [Rhizophagus irregularis DAOM 181602=DAOM 197198]
MESLKELNSRLLIEITDLRNEYAKIKAENTKLKHVIEEKAELRSRFEELEKRNKVDTNNLIAENAALKIRVAKLEKQPERLDLETYVYTSYPLGRTSSKGLSKCVPNAAQPRSLHKEVIGTQVPRSTQTQEFIPTHSEEKMPQELNMVIQPCNRSHKKQGIDELKHELFKPFSEPESSSINHNNVTEVSETARPGKVTYDSIDEASQHLAQLCDKAIDAEERANRANQEEILCWCLYWKDFRVQLDEIISKDKFGEKKARSLLYDSITKQLKLLRKQRSQELGLQLRYISRDSLRKKTQRAEKIYRLFRKVGMDKIKYIKSYSANSISKLTNEQIQEVIDYGITLEKLPLVTNDHATEISETARPGKSLSENMTSESFDGVQNNVYSKNGVNISATPNDLFLIKNESEKIDHVTEISETARPGKPLPENIASKTFDSVQNNTSPKNEVNVSATPNDLLLIKNESDIDADDSQCSDPHTLRDIPAFTSIPVTMRESNRWKGDTLSSDSSSDSSSETETESCTDSESEYNDYDAAEFYIKSFM